MSEEIVVEKPKLEPGVAPIKAEYLLSKDEILALKAKYEEEHKEQPMDTSETPENSKDEPENAAAESKNDSTNHRNKKSRRERRGIDKNRQKKMANARAEMRSKLLKLCPSVFIPGKACRFGEKCQSEHSIEKYMGQKAEDLGDKCVNFEAMGKCPFSYACRFAQSHTKDGEQVEKEPHPDYKPLLNTEFMKLQISMRKRLYDFSRADDIVKNLPEKFGAMEREKVKLNMKDLSGKTYLAPLTTVGNLPFRRLCKKLGVDITCSEMCLATSLLQGHPSEWALVKRHPSEDIFGVQIAGGFPDTMTRCAQALVDNFEIDFIDVNLGCPLDVVNEKGGGCALANKSNKLLKVVGAMNQVMKDVPLTLKFRYGIKEGVRDTHYAMKRVVEAYAPQMITVHPRSKEQRYTRPAEWDYVSKCSEAIGGKIPLWVCGDVYSPQDFYEKLESYPINGVMIGRGALIKPWLFKEIQEKQLWDISATERLDYYKEFVNYGLEHWGSDDTGIETTRKFFLEWLSFTHRYIPVGLLDVLPPKINNRPPAYRGRNEMETLLASEKAADWVKITEMFLGPVPEGFLFAPKHKANSY